jgi:hypothetical protein
MEGMMYQGVGSLAHAYPMVIKRKPGSLHRIAGGFGEFRNYSGLSYTPLYVPDVENVGSDAFHAEIASNQDGRGDRQQPMGNFPILLTSRL